MKRAKMAEKRTKIMCSNFAYSSHWLFLSLRSHSVHAAAAIDVKAHAHSFRLSNNTMIFNLEPKCAFNIHSWPFFFFF